MQHRSARNTRIAPLSEQERALLMAEVRAHGDCKAASRVGISRQTIARALARLPIQAGSVLLIRTGLASLPPQQVA